MSIWHMKRNYWNPLSTRCSLVTLYGVVELGCLWPRWWLPWQQGLGGQHGAHLWPTGLKWDPCWPHELCYPGRRWVFDVKPSPETILIARFMGPTWGPSRPSLDQRMACRLFGFGLLSEPMLNQFQVNPKEDYSNNSNQNVFWTIACKMKPMLFGIQCAMRSLTGSILPLLTVIDGRPTLL